MGEQTVPVRVVASDDDEVRVALPPDALKQILFNLVDNAREAAGGDETVTVTVDPGDEVVTLEVLDRGPGLDAAVAARIFDPFFTTKDAVTGVGLGLFVAEGLARRHGGRMEAMNRDDGPGARIRVVVPRAIPLEETGRDERTEGAP